MFRPGVHSKLNRNVDVIVSFLRSHQKSACNLLDKLASERVGALILIRFAEIQLQAKDRQNCPFCQFRQNRQQLPILSQVVSKPMDELI